MKTNFERNVSPLERIFILLSKIDKPFSNQMVLEGNGTFDVPLWQAAVAAACEANPGSRLIYRGWSRWAKWVDSGVPAPVRIFDGTHWSGDSPEGAPFLFDPLPFRQTHSCEVVLVRGNPLRVVFRTLHATMDGGGTLLWVYDIFRALRGESLNGSSSTLTDTELLSSLNYPVRKKQKAGNCLAPTGAIEGEDTGYTWKRARLIGSYSKLLPQTALAIARETLKQGQGNICFNVPFDLRLRIPGLRSTANLSRRVVLHVAPDATVDTIQEQMTHQLEHISGDPKVLKLIAYAPMGWIRYLFKFLRKKSLRSGRYPSTGSISNLGRIKVELLCGGGFDTRAAFFIPPGTEAKPFFMTLAGSPNSVEMVVSMPKGLANNGRLDRFVSNITSALKPRADKGGQMPLTG